MDVPSASTSPAASSTWDGDQALRYARSRHTSTDFDRGARQQRVLLSLRQQMDPQALIPKLPDLVAALKSTVRTDIPVSQLDELLGLASQVDTANIRSYVFAPPLYSYDTCADARGWHRRAEPSPGSSRRSRTPSRPIRGTRRSVSPLAGEGRPPLGCSMARPTRLGDRRCPPISNTTVSRHPLHEGRPKGSVPSDTVITVYNGAEEKLAATIAYLEKTFDVQVKTKTDPTIPVDVVITVGRRTPNLQAPPSS
jgi:hypothetical protein